MRQSWWKPRVRRARESFLHHSGLRRLQFSRNRSRLQRSEKAGRTHIAHVPGSGVRIIIDPRMYLKCAYCDYLFELPIVSFMKDWIRSGDHFVDVGANVGLLSLLGGRRVGPSGRVTAFEPGKFAFDLLQRNCDQNGYHWVDCRRVALGPEDGTIELNEGRPGLDAYSSLGSIVHPGARGKPFEVVVIPMITGSSWWHEWGEPRIRLMKVDVEGAELGVLRGFASAFQKQAVDALLVEVSDSMARACGYSADGVWNSMVEHGYSWWRLTGYGAVQPVTRFDQAETDYLALSEYARESFGSA